MGVVLPTRPPQKGLDFGGGGQAQPLVWGV